MQYLLLLVVVVLITLQNIISKQYNIKAKIPDTFLFSAITCFAAMLFFIVSSGFKLNFSPDFIPYSIGFAVAFALAMTGGFLAIKYGSLSITMLVTSYSLIVPTFYGIFALKEALSIIGAFGIVLLLVSLFLISDRKEKGAFSFKWIISLIVSFVGNGMCSTVQKMQQIAFSGDYKNEFMIVAMLLSTIFLFAIALKNKKSFKEDLKLNVSYGMLKGVANGIVNFFVMVLTGIIPNAILFPSVSAGGIVLGFITSVFFYKEKLSKIQLFGYVIGTLSVILLNI